MKYYRKTKAFLLIFSIGALVSISGCHRGGWHSTPEEKIEAIQERISDKLDLNEEQEKKLTDLTKEAMTVYNSMKEDKKSQRSSYIEIFKERNLTSNEFMEIYKNKQTAFDPHIEGIIEKLTAFQNSLSKGQKQEIIELIEKFQKRRKH